MKRGFVLHHNGPPARCVGQPHSRCVAFWAGVKRFHTSKPPKGQGWSDIAYSFGVCPHGVRFTGRGWNKNQFAGGDDVVGHDDGPDSAWYSVLVFLGGDDSTDDTERPTTAMVDGVIGLLDEGRDSGRCGRRVLPHSAFKPKPCPGPEFTALARKWDNADLAPPEPPTPAPEPEEPEMLIIDSPGKPALVIGVGGVKQINPTERNALRSLDVLPKQVNAATWDALYGLREPTPLPVDVDEAAIAVAVTAALPDEVTDDVTVAEIVAAVRSVFADAGTVG